MLNKLLLLGLTLFTLNFQEVRIAEAGCYPVQVQVNVSADSFSGPGWYLAYVSLKPVKGHYHENLPGSGADSIELSVQRNQANCLARLSSGTFCDNWLSKDELITECGTFKIVN